MFKLLSLLQFLIMDRQPWYHDSFRGTTSWLFVAIMIIDWARIHVNKNNPATLGDAQVDQFNWINNLLSVPSHNFSFWDPLNCILDVSNESVFWGNCEYTVAHDQSTSTMYQELLFISKYGELIILPFYCPLNYIFCWCFTAQVLKVCRIPGYIAHSHMSQPCTIQPPCLESCVVGL